MNVIFIGENLIPYEKILDKSSNVILLYTKRSEKNFLILKKKYKEKINSSYIFDGTSIFSSFETIYKLSIKTKKNIKINVTGCSKITLFGIFIALGKIDKKIDLEYLLDDEIYSFPKFSINFKIDNIIKKRTKKKLKILELLYEKNEIKNIEIAKIIGNVKSAVTFYMKDLIDNNLVVKEDNKYVITKFGKDVYLILKFEENIKYK